MSPYVRSQAGTHQHIAFRQIVLNTDRVLGESADRTGAERRGTREAGTRITDAPTENGNLMHQYSLALIGFGGVARALAEIIRDNGDHIARELGFSLRVVAITDLNLGTLIQPTGIGLTAALAVTREQTFAAFAGGSPEADNARAIRDSGADIVVEATFTNPITGEPALSHVRQALEAGISVTTTNKGPVAIAAEELTSLAHRTGAHFEFEGAVMSGTPVLRFARQQLAGTRIVAIEGILNGTTNYVLGRQEDGLSQDEAIAEAQARGYAEADPTADISGSDVRLKVAILAEQVMGERIPLEDIATTGISAVTAADIASARETGARWKLVGSVARATDGTVSARVAPMALPEDHPLTGISGPTNAVTFSTELVDQVTVSGPGAGRMQTAFALLSDIIAIDTARGRRS